MKIFFKDPEEKSFNEICELADKWLSQQIGRENIKKFSEIEKYWMKEGFIRGYMTAQETILKIKI